MSRPTLSTTTGDKGTTGLYGGQRVTKCSDRIQAYGDVDELNAVLGLILSEQELPKVLRTQLAEVQRTLFVLGADLATPLESSAKVDRITEDHVKVLEQWGMRLEEELPQLQHFVLPSGSQVGCLLHLARTVCRRAERWVVALCEKEHVSEPARIYINRLSDYLFLAARSANKALDQEEREWIPEQIRVTPKN